MAAVVKTPASEGVAYNVYGSKLVAGSTTDGGRVWARPRGAPRRPRKWLTFSTGSQSSKPSLQQNSSSVAGRAATHAWA